MARGNRKQSTFSLSDISIRSLFIHPVTIMVGGMLAVVAVAIGLWNQFQDSIPVNGDQRLSPENVLLTEQPDWIKINLKETAFRDSQLSDLTLRRPDVVAQVKNAFGVISWIESIERIDKSATGVTVDVVFRRPVAVVEVGDNRLIPIDAKSVVLDGRGFTEDDIFNYWRVNVPQPITAALTTGATWDDIRLAGASAIAGTLENHRLSAGLFRIVNPTYPTRDRQRMKPYQLWTKRGNTIIWGNPPGQEAKGEADAQTKIEAILVHVAQHGSLDASSDRHFDVRNGRLEPAGNPNLALDPNDFIFFK